MEDLKTILFRETLYHSGEYLILKKNFSEFDYIVDIQHAKFSVLHELIEESGLEDEYQKWKEGQLNDTSNN